MFISWGTKSYRRKEGVAVDFCSLCRSASIVEVQQIRSQGHVYGIGLGQGKVVGHVVKCLNCESEWALQAGTIQNSLNPTVPMSLEEILEETFPRFSIVFGERLEQEAALATDPFSLDAQTRLQLIAEPFFVLDNDIQKESHKTSLANVVHGLGCLFTIGVLLVSLVAFLASAPLYGGLGLLLTGGLIWLLLHLINQETARFMRTKIYPKLALCLAPLRPSTEELSTVLAHIESKAANQTKLDDFLPLLEAAYTQRPVAQANTNR